MYDTARVEAYGDVATTISGTINAALGGMAQSRDSADVARAIVALANAPAGTRPLRTTVPADEATDAINASTAAIQAKVIEAFGLGDLVRTAARV